MTLPTAAEEEARIAAYKAELRQRRLYARRQKPAMEIELSRRVEQGLLADKRLGRCLIDAWTASCSAGILDHKYARERAEYEIWKEVVRAKRVELEKAGYRVKIEDYNELGMYHLALDISW
jgi:hypothetical protein